MIVKQPSTPYTNKNISHVISSVLIITLPSKNSMINAIPIEPTSPAKHLALPFGRKLNIQNIIAAIIVVTISDCATYSLSVFKATNGSKTANEYPAVIPFIPSIKLITFVAPT